MIPFVLAIVGAIVAGVLWTLVGAVVWHYGVLGRRFDATRRIDQLHRAIYNRDRVRRRP